MKISNELLAAYAEGNVTKEERNQVRQYLAENPQELESVMMMMDDDYELVPNADDSLSHSESLTIGRSSAELRRSKGLVDDTKNAIPKVAATVVKHSSFSDLCYSAAAFAPMTNPLQEKVSVTRVNTTNESFSKRLDDLMDELGI